MSNLTQPGILSRLTCLFFGHKLLWDGAIKTRPTPTLTNFIYKEDADSITSVGLCFCARCYSFTGLHFSQKKTVEDQLETTAKLGVKTKKSKLSKSEKDAVKKFKK